MKTPSMVRRTGITAMAAATLFGMTALAMTAPRPARAQTAKSPNVNLSMKNAEIRDVLTRLFRDARADFGIDPAVQGRITITVKNMPFEDALKSILRVSGEYTYVKEGGVYLVKPGKLPAETAPRGSRAQPAPLPTITIDLQDAPIRPALEQIFRTVKVDFSIDPAVRGSVNLKTTDVPFEKALWLILRSATTPYTYAKEGGVYRVRPGMLPEEPTTTPLPLSAPQAEPKPVALPSLTLDFKDAPIRAALEEIFRQAKVDYAIDPTVQGYVNLKVTDMPFENVLKLILRSSNTPLTYTKDDGVYIVRPRTVGAAAPTPPVLARETDAPTRVDYDRIELTYADPVDLAQLLNITMIPIGTRFGLNTPGATGIVKPGTRGAGTPPGATGTAPGSGGKDGGTVVNSGGPGNGPGGSGIFGL